MSLTIGTNIDYKGPLPNFDRDRFATYSDMISSDINDYEVGHVVYVRRWDYDGTGRFAEIFERGLQSATGYTPDNDPQHPHQEILTDTVSDHYAGTSYIRSKSYNGSTWVDSWTEFRDYMGVLGGDVTYREINSI